jgi:hypothetical protein
MIRLQMIHLRLLSAVTLIVAGLEFQQGNTDMHWKQKIQTTTRALFNRARTTCDGGRLLLLEALATLMTLRKVHTVISRRRILRKKTILTLNSTPRNLSEVQLMQIVIQVDP